MTNYFEGSYIDELRDMLLASLVAGVNGLVVSEPGWGKTAVAKSLAEQVVGKHHYNLAAISPMTSPMVVKGALDNDKFFQTSTVVYKQDGTPYDPEMDVFILDEFGRGSDPLLEEVLHATDPKKQDHCVAWGTSNFLPKSARLAAVLDRFPMRLWMNPSDFDAEKMAYVQCMGLKNLQVCGVTLTREKLQEVRAAVPTQNSAKAVAGFIGELHRAAVEEGLRMNPRLTDNWQKILFYNSVLHTGTNDFTDIPNEVKALMVYAWPSTDENEAATWKRIVNQMKDRVGAALEAILANIATEYRRIAKITNPIDRMKETQNIAGKLAAAQREIADIADGDPREDKALQQIMEFAAAAMKGQEPKLGSLV